MESRPIIVVIIIVTLSVTSGKKQNRQDAKCTYTLAKGKACSAVELKCCPGSVIYNPEVFGDVANCTSKASCNGSSPNLMVERLECYWKESCNITYPTTPLLFGGCDFRIAKCLRIFGWKCLKIDAQRFLMTNTTNTAQYIGGKTIKTGIVRSHDTYPWNYNYKTFENCNSGNCLLQFSPVDDLNREQRVMLTVDSADIDLENDEAYIENGSKSLKLTELVGETKVFEPGQKVTLHFQTTGDEEFETKGGKGFVICFKFVKKTVNGSRRHLPNICDELMTPALPDLSPTRTSCPGAKKPRGKLSCGKRRTNGKRKNKKYCKRKIRKNKRQRNQRNRKRRRRTNK